jgi:hypothetical protein
MFKLLSIWTRLDFTSTLLLVIAAISFALVVLFLWLGKSRGHCAT